MSSENKHPLYLWRKAAGLSCGKAAAKVGCCRLQFWRWENGLSTPRKFMGKIVILTNGAVTADAWLNQEAAKVAKAFRAPSRRKAQEDEPIAA